MMILIGLLILAGGVLYAVSVHRAVAKKEMEMRYMQTSSIADAVDIFESMEGVSFDYRHYVELSGTAMTDEPVYGPYSKRQVAYYEATCFSVNEVSVQSDGNTKIRREESPLTTEQSPVPFYLTDSSGNHKIYVDLESFGDSVDLVTSCNRMEGPNSDFARGTGASASGDAANTSSGNGGNAANISISTAVREFLAHSARYRQAAAGFRTQPALCGAAAACGFGVAELSLRSAADSFVAFDPNRGGARPPRPSGGSKGGNSRAGSRPGPSRPATPRPSAPRSSAPRSGFPGSGAKAGRPSGTGGKQVRSSSSQRSGGFGNSGGSFGGFGGLGGFGFGDMGGPGRPPGRRPRTGMGPLIIGAELAGTGQRSHSRFLGYRLMEEVVPLSRPLYVLGEIYRNGDRLYIGRATGKTAESWFSTRPESEILEKLRNKKKTASGIAILAAVLAVVCIALELF